jgi:ABC-type sugar transport system permease subunit
MSDTSLQQQTARVDASASVSSQEQTRRPFRWHRELTGWAFILPLLLVYVLFLLVPILLGLRLSFFNASLVGSGVNQFIGLANYVEVLRDPNFWGAVWNTIIFTVISTPILIILSLIIAIMVNSIRRFQWIYRIAFFAPYTLSITVMVLIWNWLYQPGFGLINSALTSLGLPSVNWLSQIPVAMVSIIIISVWWTFGFNFLLYLAGLQQISKDMYEASALDGAGWWSQVRHITIPLLSRQTVLILILQVVASLQLFGQSYLLTSGGPNFSTRSAIEYIYDSGFTNFRVGYASAMSYLFFIVILLVSLVQFGVALRQRRNG